jgi:hypothetical protein
MSESYNTERNATATAPNQNPGTIELRLDTEGLMRDLRLNLQGNDLVPEIDKDTGIMVLVVKPTTEPILNARGIHRVLMMIRLVTNSLGVQGNWKSEYFEQFICEFDCELSVNCWVNNDDWNLDMKEYNHLCDSIIGFCQQFHSRLIDNKERESYNMMKTSENIVQQVPKKGFLGMG